MVSALLGDKPHKCHDLPEDVKFFTLVAGIRRVKDPMYLLDAFSGMYTRNTGSIVLVLSPPVDMR